MNGLILAFNIVFLMYSMSRVHVSFDHVKLFTSYMIGDEIRSDILNKVIPKQTLFVWYLYQGELSRHH